MAIVSVPDEQTTLRDPGEMTERLERIGITYQQWQPRHTIARDASAEEILEAYSEDIERLKVSGGYVTADVIDVKPEMPGLEALLDKFRREHWHDEDEVRFIIEGSGVFFIRPREGPVVSIEVTAGDLLRVPRGTWHWFDLCAERRIRAIRLFQDPNGWTPHYTESGVDAGYTPLCLGPGQI